jgi:hypothetical protein
VTELRVGAGKKEICIPQEYLALEGFGIVHDPIHARAVVIGAQEQIVIISLEITSMPEDEINMIRQMISERTGIKEANIWVCATHSFSSPHLLPNAALKTEKNIQLKEAYRSSIHEAVCIAVDNAVEKLRPARMGFGKGICDIVANRDVELEDGWWVGTNGEGLTDRTVSVIRFDDREGNPIAIISHFSMQSSVLDQSELTNGGKAVTSDVAGNACAKAEEAFGKDTVVMYMIGAAGDQAPIEKAVGEHFEDKKRVRSDLHEEGFAICDKLSDELKDSICTVAEEIECNQDETQIEVYIMKTIVPAKKMDKDIHSLMPVRECTYVDDGEKEVSIEGIRIGNIAFIGVQPELNCKTATSILGMSDFDMTLVCTMVNGASKYMADESAYDRCCYEAMNSPFGRGAAELISDKGIELLRYLNRENVTECE